MMGTGEASGEKRALTAAEAAISNPLIDDNSMKGARGLLISTTGGRDLTLYEVDEAATRIREEVDQDANIIVGATFDESLEGIIRVSVVATGIDQVVAAKPAAPVTASVPSAKAVESRLSELTQQLRANTQRLAERVQRSEPAPVDTPAAPVAESVAPAAALAEAIAAPQQAAKPAPALEDVTIRPLPPKPTLFIESASEAPTHEAASEKAFIPPLPERPAARPRMPRIEDLPLPAQNEIRAKRAALAEADKPRPSLLQRLASVGLGRKTDEPAARPQAARSPVSRPHADRLPPYPAPRALEPRTQDPRAQDPRIQDPRAQDPRAQDPRAQDPRAQDPRPAESRIQEPVSEYAKRPSAPRPAPQGLDLHGRPAPVAASIDDDQLEIPAFLRRQAN
jgi:cell division protein FtsZ